MTRSTLIKILSLAFAVVNVQLAAADQQFMDIQWPAGEGICTGPYVFNVYNSCNQITVTAGEAIVAPNCSVATVEDYADDSCPMGTEDYTCQRQDGWITERADDVKVFPCDDHCQEYICDREKHLALLNRPAGSEATFVAGSSHLDNRRDWACAELSVGTRCGNKTQLCDYDVKIPNVVNTTCTRQARTKCKSRVTFVGECTHINCGVKTTTANGIEKLVQERSEFGARRIDVLRENQARMVPDSLRCATCDGEPESLGLERVQDLGAYWLTRKVTCLLTQHEIFKAGLSTPAVQRNGPYKVKMENSLNTILEVLAGIDGLQETNPSLAIPAQQRSQMQQILLDITF